MPDALASPPDLRAVLAEAQRLGFLGPGDLDRTIAHAASYAAWCASGPAQVLDLGSGGGIPGLVLAVREPDWRVDLLDGSERRCSFLRRAVSRLALTGRVRVLEGRVEDLARRSDLRASSDVVVARGFGPPAVTAECASPFLRVGGRLVVSSRPDAWATVPAASFGLASVTIPPGGFVVFDQVAPCPERYPRRAVARQGS